MVRLQYAPRCGWPMPDANVGVLEFPDYTWAIILRDSGLPVGAIGYHPYGKNIIPIGENDIELGSTTAQEGPYVCSSWSLNWFSIIKIA